MNEACAAGTGSFLEEQAEKLGIDIIGEFADLALQSTAPIRLGERCTVFMERDVMSYQQRGARREGPGGRPRLLDRLQLPQPPGARAQDRRLHLLPGRHRLQRRRGGRLRQILGKEIIVPPHNGVMGAIGMALLARERMRRTGEVTTFRGWDLAAGRLHRQGLRLQGLLQRVRHPPVHDRGREDLLGRQVLRPLPQARQGRQGARDRRPRGAARASCCSRPTRRPRERAAAAGAHDVGIPRTMYTFDRLPFWATFFAELGYRARSSRARPTRASARPASTSPWPSRASRSAWRTATSRRCSTRAPTTSSCRTC